MLDSAHVIRGTDLLAHNRGKNSDLDEWLKDAAEVLLLFLCAFFFCIFLGIFYT